MSIEQAESNLVDRIIAGTQSFDEALKAYTDEVLKRRGKRAIAIETTTGKRYTKVIEVALSNLAGNRAVHSFVDTATGDIYFPGGWSSPAKHVRGNIFKGVASGFGLSHTGAVAPLRRSY